MPSYSWILNVLEAICHAQTIMLLVVTETMLCFNRLRHHLDQLFRGCPLLIQVSFWPSFVVCFLMLLNWALEPR